MNFYKFELPNQRKDVYYVKEMAWLCKSCIDNLVKTSQMDSDNRLKGYIQCQKSIGKVIQHLQEETAS